MLMLYRNRQGRAGRLAMPMLAILLLVSVFGMVWLRSSIMSVEYRIGALEAQRAEALRERNVLAADLASLLSLEEVEERRMALVFPDRRNVFYVKRDAEGAPQVASYGSR
jgi:hypothetical protein